MKKPLPITGVAIKKWPAQYVDAGAEVAWDGFLLAKKIPFGGQGLWVIMQKILQVYRLMLTLRVPVGALWASWSALRLRVEESL